MPETKPMTTGPLVPEDPCPRCGHTAKDGPVLKKVADLCASLTKPVVDIEELRELERKATPGPWRHDRETDFVWGPKGQMIASEGNGEGPWGSMQVRGCGEGLPMDTNGALMCAARNALPALLDELERLRATLKQAEEASYSDEEASINQAVRLAAVEAERDLLRDKLEENARAYAIDCQSMMEDRDNVLRERDSLKAKLARVEKWRDRYSRLLDDADMYDDLLAILKEKP